MVKSVERNRGKEMRFMRRIIMALMLATLVAFAVAGAAWVLVAPPAKAAFPGQNGRIVFWRVDSGGFAQTWVANRDLSNQHKLTVQQRLGGLEAWWRQTGLRFRSRRSGLGRTHRHLRDQRHLQDEPRWDGGRQADRLQVLQRQPRMVP
jgi:hypothetical protein